MPRGYPKDPDNKRARPIAQVAKESAPKRSVKTTPETTQTETLTSEGIVSLPNEESPLVSQSQSNLSVSPLMTTEINVTSVKDAAIDEGLTATNAYAAKRIGDLSKQEVLAKILKIRQIARQKNYRLDALVHAPDQLQAALDDYDLTCFNLGLYPLQNLLAVWLNTTSAQLIALTSAANVSESGQMLATHNDYCISVISSSAMLSDKPPLFSIYYLKTAYRMFDQEKQHAGGNLSLISGNVVQNISINAADISKNSKLFAEIDDKNN